MNELETSIVDISEDALDDLFNETPEKTVSAETLVGGKKLDKAEPEEIEDDEEEEIEEVKPKKKATSKTKADFKPETQNLETFELEDLDDEEKEEEEKKPAKAKAVKEEAPAEEEKVVDEKTKDAQEAKGDDAPEVLSVLKSTVDYLVESGIWQDFEGRDQMEMTEDTYAKLVAEQDRLRVEGMFGELVDSTGPFGKAIIDFVKSGGNPDEIIDLFKEQKSIESISIDSADGQKDLIKHYYSEVLGWKQEKIDKYVSGLMLSNELENEAKEVKDLFSQYYTKESERLTAENRAHETKQKEAEQAFEGNIRATIKERKDLTIAEKKAVEDYLLSYDQKLPNGKFVNKFYVNFAKMQANPADYVDLVLFTMDKEKFMKKVSTTEKTKAVAEAFKFIKGNGAVSTKKGTTHEQLKKAEKTSSFDWGMPRK